MLNFEKEFNQIESLLNSGIVKILDNYSKNSKNLSETTRVIFFIFLYIDRGELHLFVPLLN
jgi:hypothetical protein